MNSLVRVFCAGLTASFAFMASLPTVWATDLPESVPEVVITAPAVGGWYLRGDIGYSWDRFKRADYTVVGDCDTCGGLNLGENTLDGNLNGSFLIGGGAGYQVTDYFRTDLTLDYMTRSRFSGHTSGPACDGNAGCVSDLRGHYSALSILANAYVDLGNLGGVTPYVGAGIGGTRIDWGNFVDVSSGILQEGAANWRFTYALMAGASVDLTHKLKLDAGYRYRHVDDGKMFEGSQGISAGYDKGMNIHDIRIGLRYMFGG